MNTVTTGQTRERVKTIPLTCLQIAQLAAACVLPNAMIRMLSAKSGVVMETAQAIRSLCFTIVHFRVESARMPVWIHTSRVHSGDKWVSATKIRASCTRHVHRVAMYVVVWRVWIKTSRNVAYGEKRSALTILWLS